MKIIGAGFAGLIAAHVWQRAPVIEAASGPRQSHRALLRFRSDAIGKLIGVDFKPVTVHKGIWHNGGFVAPSIEMANRYSLKCLGSLRGDRSIWKTETVTRWIAPEDLYERLVDSVHARIVWGEQHDFANELGAVINTAPLPYVVKSLSIDQGIRFDRSPIRVSRHRIANCDLYQTVYFPTANHSVYRASITGSLLIVEHAREPHGDWMADVERAFSLGGANVLFQDEVDQRYGKIVPLDEADRKAYLYRLTSQHRIYSLGRFATWRNILLDDLIKDIDVIRRLITRSGDYELSLAGA